MRKLPAAAQEERRRQVIGLRRAGQTYDAIAARVGLTRTGVCSSSTPFGVAGPPPQGMRRAAACGCGMWLLRSAGGRAAETTVDRL